MTEEPREKFQGRSVSEWLTDKLGELEHDAIDIYVVMAAGRRSFCLENDRLEEFARRAILTLLRAGARPVEGADPPVYWRLLPGYEGTPEEVTERILSGWKQAGRPDAKLDETWFALPHMNIWFALPSRCRS